MWNMANNDPGKFFIMNLQAEKANFQKAQQAFFSLYGFKPGSIETPRGYLKNATVYNVVPTVKEKLPAYFTDISTFLKYIIPMGSAKPLFIQGNVVYTPAQLQSGFLDILRGGEQRSIQNANSLMTQQLLPILYCPFFSKSAANHRQRSQGKSNER